MKARRLIEGSLYEPELSASFSKALTKLGVRSPTTSAPIPGPSKTPECVWRTPVSSSLATAATILSASRWMPCK